MGQILDGKKISAEVLEEVKNRAEACAKQGTRPGLATVLVGDDPASHVYVGQKIKKCQANGLSSIHRPIPASVSQSELLKIVEDLNANPEVHGIIVQLPLPKHINSDEIVRAVSAKKDADGLHPLNQGIVAGLKSWKEIEMSGVPLPCTPSGVVHMLLREKIEISGKHVVVVGRSNLVGKPVAQLFLSLNATVTIVHSRTPDVFAFTKEADILIAALGKPDYIYKDGVKEGAVVVDVGISRTENGLKGDVDFNSVKDKASWITPVPGGVGPMTVAMLLRNTVRAAEISLKNQSIINK